MWYVSPVPEANMQRVVCGQNKFCAGRVWKHREHAFSEPLTGMCAHCASERAVWAVCLSHGLPWGCLFHRIHLGKLSQAVREACLTRMGRVEIVAKVTLWLASAAEGLVCSGWRAPDGMSQEMNSTP